MPDLLDQWGRPVHTELLKYPQAAATYAGIRNIYSVAHPSSGITPERLTAILRQAEFGDPWLYLELAQEMEEKDLHYLSVLSTRKQTVAQLEVAIKPWNDTDKQALADAEFVREVLLDDGGLELQTTFADISDAIGKGFSCMEIMWNTAGKEWLPSRLVWRDPRWFMFDWISGEQVLVRTWRNEQGVPNATDAWTDDGWKFEMSGLIERTPQMASIGIQPATAPLIPYKFITHFAKAKSGLPIRGGLARAVSWIYMFKTYIVKDWITFAERYGMPSRIGQYPPGTTDDDKNSLLRAVAQLGSDASTIIPESMKIALLESHFGGGQRAAGVYPDAAMYFDNAMSKAVLGQTLTTEMPHRGQGGSRAAAQVHEDVRRDILQWDAVRLAQTLTRDLVKPLIDLNRGPRDRYPSIMLKMETSADKPWIEMVGIAADHGVEIGQDAVRNQLGVPAPIEGEKILTPKQILAKEAIDSDRNPGAPKIDLRSPRSGEADRTGTAPVERVEDPTPDDKKTQASTHAGEPQDPQEDGRARVVVLEDGKVWTVTFPDGHGMQLPGGHVEPGETVRAAAEREAAEEAGFTVEIQAWLTDFVDENAHRRYYVARRTSPVAGDTYQRVDDDDESGRVEVKLTPTDEALAKLSSEYDCAALRRAIRGQVATHAPQRRRRRNPRTKIDTYAKRLANDWRPAMEPLIQSVIAHIANARDLPDAQDRLHELVDELDVSHLQKAVHQATFNVRAAARAKVRLP
jgi:phage gp29-like protein